MSGHKSVVDLEVVEAPWNKQVTVQECVYPGDFQMLRLRIKEGRRFTDLELDATTAARLARLLSDWAEART